MSGCYRLILRSCGRARLAAGQILAVLAQRPVHEMLPLHASIPRGVAMHLLALLLACRLLTVCCILQHLRWVHWRPGHYHSCDEHLQCRPTSAFVHCARCLGCSERPCISAGPVLAGENQQGLKNLRTVPCAALRQRQCWIDAPTLLHKYTLHLHCIVWYLTSMAISTDGNYHDAAMLMFAGGCAGLQL